VAGPLNLDSPYQHQYFVTVGINAAQGGTFSNSTGWYDSGASLNLTALANAKWRFEYWDGTGTGSYNGTKANPTFTILGSTTETAVYYPSLVITVSQGGSVRYLCGAVSGAIEEGTNSTLYLPLGENLTLTATPSSVLQVFQAWSGDVTGKAERTSLVIQGPATVTAAFGVNIVGIAEAVAAGAAVAAVVLALFMTRRRRPRIRRVPLQKKEGWL
jgi:hypothetical protein